MIEGDGPFALERQAFAQKKLAQVADRDVTHAARFGDHQAQGDLAHAAHGQVRILTSFAAVRRARRAGAAQHASGTLL
jgi:hypothetical protein